MSQTRTEALRDLHRARRALLSAATTLANASALQSRVSPLPEFKRARHIAAYIAIRGEMDVAPLMDVAKGKCFYLPVLRGESMHFAPWTPGQTLRKKGFGLLEPETDSDQWIAPSQLDLVLVPLVVFDAQCNRIGQGGGYYDRTFSFRMPATEPGRAGGARPSPLLLGVAHEAQREIALQPKRWDVPLDAVATEVAIYWRVAEDSAPQ